MIERASDIANAAPQILDRLRPVNPDCKIAIVIPVYKEFLHGRIALLLDELSKQTVKTGAFETILVVNNPALNTTPAKQEGFEDNKALIEFLRKQHSLGLFTNVQAVDCTNGELPERHIGLIRGLGNEVACSRMAQTKAGRNGIIVQMDADASVDPDFLEKLEGIYEEVPSTESVSLPISPLPVDYTSDDQYLEYAKQFLRIVTHLREGKNPRVFHGPTLSFKAYLHQKPEIRLYMGYQMNEDYNLGENLYKYSRFIYAPEPRVFVGDRRRAEGFDAMLRAAYNITSDPVRPVLQDDMIPYLEREETLARSRLDWGKVDQSLVQTGILLFCRGRADIGSSQALKTYHE